MAESVGSQWLFMSDVCKHCTNAGCLDACPTGALIRTEYQTVVLQPDVCNGCGLCVPACPFGVVDRDHLDGRAAKCTLCYDRLEDGLEPACAKACPTDSIVFGPHEELVELAERRVATLHRRGVDGAYLYGAGDEPDHDLAGGLGAFFLLTEPPERFGLPAEAESPVQENVVRRDGRGGRRRAARGGRRRVGVRDRTEGPVSGDDARARGETPRRRSARGASRPRGGGRPRTSTWPSRGPRGATPPGRSSTDATRSYGDVEPEDGEVAAANRRMRSGEMPGDLRGPFIKPPVWTWEVPVYFWVGGVASGSAFVALAADLAGDEWSAAVARKVALAAVLPAPVLLIADLGRPARFLNMLRIFKPRSPMNMGAWCLVAFTGVAAGAVGADLLGRPRTARRLGAVNALLGGYLGSYTGVLLAATAVPVWARSRIFLGPIFVSTATATGAAATRLTMAAAGQPEDHPTRRALGRLEAAAILTELTLSTVNERRLGRVGEVFSQGRPRRLFRTAKRLVGVGLALNVLGPRRFRTPVEHVASLLYLAGGLAFRFAWVEAGKASARDDEAVALMARGGTADEHLRTARSAAPPTARRSHPAPPLRRCARGAEPSAARACWWSACCGGPDCQRRRWVRTRSLSVGLRRPAASTATTR